MSTPDPNAPLLDARNVTIRFGGLTAVSAFNLKIVPHELLVHGGEPHRAGDVAGFGECGHQQRRLSGTSSPQTDVRGLGSMRRCDELGSLTSLLTMVGGKIVYAAEPFAALGPDWPK